MTVLSKWSEPFAATGGLAAEGVVNQLGRPDMEFLEVLIREAIQNCWDAKRDDAGAVTVEIARHQLSAKEKAYLTDEVLPNPPPGLGLADALAGDVTLLTFADFGTLGLGGPTRADQALDGASRDFVDFVRNIGQPPDNDFGGGSYGYGKGAFYIASNAQTVIVDTLTEVDGNLERRLIAYALGDHFAEGGIQFTGRHWWGVVSDSVPEPVIGESARRIASKLGLPDREGPDGMGTTVSIVAPSVELPVDSSGYDPTFDFIGEALAWNFWPRMVETVGAPPTLNFRLIDDGKQILVPNPAEHQRLRVFVEAIAELRSGAESEGPLSSLVSIDVKAPRKHLGTLALQRSPVADITLPDGRLHPSGAVETARALHHVALMRNAELVVKYYRAPEPPLGTTFGYGGVFRCSPAVDQAFRRSEPPTHDDWVSKALKDRHERTYVNVALRRIGEACAEFAGLTVGSAAEIGSADIPLGEFADAMGALISTVDGIGARRSKVAGKKPKSPKKRGLGAESIDAETIWVEGEASSATDGAETVNRGDTAPGSAATADLPPPRYRMVGDPELTLDAQGTAMIAFPFELESNGNELEIAARVEIMTNDGLQVETDPPVGADVPSVESWVRPDDLVVEGPRITCSSDDADGSWTALVPHQEDLMIRLKLEIVAI